MELIERQNAERARLDRLRQERGAAVVDGKKFDHAAIATTLAEIEALQDAEAVATERVRAAAAAEHAEKVQALRTEFADREAAKVKAIEIAETHARAMADALRLAVNYAADARKVAGQLNTRSHTDVEIQSEPEFINGLARRVAAQLRTITGHPGRFGMFEFHGTLPDPKSPWL